MTTAYITVLRGEIACDCGGQMKRDERVCSNCDSAEGLRFEDDVVEIELEATANRITKGYAGSYWQPAEGPEAQDLVVECEGKEFALTDSELEYAHEKVIEVAEEERREARGW